MFYTWSNDNTSFFAYTVTRLQMIICTETRKTSTSLLRIGLSFSYISCKTAMRLVRSKMMSKLQRNFVTSVLKIFIYVWTEICPDPCLQILSHLLLVSTFAFVARNVHQKSLRINIAECLCEVKFRLVMEWNCTGKKRFWMLNILV